MKNIIMRILKSPSICSNNYEFTFNLHVPRKIHHVHAKFLLCCQFKAFCICIIIDITETPIDDLAKGLVERLTQIKERVLS